MRLKPHFDNCRLSPETPTHGYHVVSNQHVARPKQDNLIQSDFWHDNRQRLKTFDRLRSRIVQEPQNTLLSLCSPFSLPVYVVIRVWIRVVETPTLFFSGAHDTKGDRFQQRLPVQNVIAEQQCSLRPKWIHT